MDLNTLKRLRKEEENQMNERVRKNLGYVANGIKDLIWDCNSILETIENATEMEDVFYIEDKISRIERSAEILRERTREIPDMFDEEE